MTLGIRESRLAAYASLSASVGSLVCCALPSVLVLLGPGASLASVLSAAPWLVVLSRHKGWVFGIAGLMIAAGVAVQKLEGVETVDVSLNEGLALIRLKPGNGVTVDQVRQVIRRNGFTPKTAEIRVAGRVTEQNGQPALLAGRKDQVYWLRESPAAVGVLALIEQAAADRPLIIEGVVPESQETGETSWTLVVRRFEAPSGPEH